MVAEAVQFQTVQLIAEAANHPSRKIETSAYRSALRLAGMTNT
jgi:hypothetical protein